MYPVYVAVVVDVIDLMDLLAMTMCVHYIVNVEIKKRMCVCVYTYAGNRRCGANPYLGAAAACK
jgi:hypothetical protein